MNESGLLNEHTTDLSPIMSSYLCEENEKRYHLHPEAIRLNTAKNEVCDFCVLVVFRLLVKNVMPEQSILKHWMLNCNKQREMFLEKKCVNHQCRLHQGVIMEFFHE